MQITETKIKVSELCQGYTDDGDGGVYGYDDGNHKLTRKNNGLDTEL